MRFFKSVFWFFPFVGSFAGVFDHLSPARDKGEFSGIEGVDCIYMINLDRRPEKFVQASKELLAYGIVPYRFPTIDGSKLSLEVINDVGLRYRKGMPRIFTKSFPLEGEGVVSNEFLADKDRAYFSHEMNLGRIGCVMSHLSVLQDAFHFGYETVWVLEDDILVEKDPNILTRMIEDLDRIVGKDNWDILFTDPNTRSCQGTPILVYGAARHPAFDCSLDARYDPKYTIREPISEDIERVGSRFGAYSMIIRRSGIEKLLRFFREHQIYLPYDLEYYIVPDIRLYGLRYGVVTNFLEAITDTGRFE